MMKNKLTRRRKENKAYFIVFISLFLLNSINGQGVKKVSNTSSSFNNNSNRSYNVYDPSTSSNRPIIVEAEYFDTQSESAKRQWYLTSETTTPKVRKDSDKPHLDGASQRKYLELLPDTNYEKSKKTQGKNYSEIPGKMAVVTYNVDFMTSGKYYVWIKGYATSGQDNSLHVGVNSDWPESGKQLYMCEKTWNKWSWSSFQFKHSEGCNTKKRISIDIKKPGMSKVMFSMREDGIEFDKFLLTKNPNFIPE